MARGVTRLYSTGGRNKFAWASAGG